MTFEEFETIFNKLVKLHKAADAWIDSVPAEISVAFFDNPYATNLCLANDALMKALFKEGLCEEVSWFLYERRPGHETIEVGAEDDIKTYVIGSPEDFVRYIKEQYFGM